MKNNNNKHIFRRHRSEQKKSSQVDVLQFQPDT